MLLSVGWPLGGAPSTQGARDSQVRSRPEPYLQTEPRWPEVAKLQGLATWPLRACGLRGGKFARVCLLPAARCSAGSAIHACTASVYRYTWQVIASFADQGTEDLYNGDNTKPARSIPKDIWAVARRKLDMLNAATAIDDLRVPPGNRLEALRGGLAGRYSIRINDQFRVVFRFANGHASDVRICDYHG